MKKLLPLLLLGACSTETSGPGNFEDLLQRFNFSNVEVTREDGTRDFYDLEPRGLLAWESAVLDVEVSWESSEHFAPCKLQATFDQGNLDFAPAVCDDDETGVRGSGVLREESIELDLNILHEGSAERWTIFGWQ